MTTSASSKDKPLLLLVNPYIEDFAAYDHFSKPYGLLRLAGYLKEHYRLTFLNTLSRNHPSVGQLKTNQDGTGHFYKTFIQKPKAIADIPRRFKRYGIPETAFLNELFSLEEKPKAIFLTSGMTYWYSGILYTIGLIRQIFPDVPIVLGGVYPSLLPDHARKTMPADFIIGSQQLDKVLEVLSSYLDVVFIHNEKSPAYELLGEYAYAPLMLSEGCVFACDYCASPYLSPFRQFDADLAFQSIYRLYHEFGTQNFAFYDDALLYNSSNHLDPILRKIIDSGIKAHFHTPNGLHIRFLTRETALLMKQAGFVDIRLSLESAESEFQLTHGAKAVNAEFERAMEILTLAGFSQSNIHVYTLLNVPDQKRDSIERTMRYIYEKGALPKLAFYSPIPRTPDFKRASQICNLDDPLSHNNTVYLYRSGFDMSLLHHLKKLEQDYRNS